MKEQPSRDILLTLLPPTMLEIVLHDARKLDSKMREICHPRGERSGTWYLCNPGGNQRTGFFVSAPRTDPIRRRISTEWWCQAEKIVARCEHKTAETAVHSVWNFSQLIRDEEEIDFLDSWPFVVQVKLGSRQIIAAIEWAP